MATSFIRKDGSPIRIIPPSWDEWVFKMMITALPSATMDQTFGLSSRQSESLKGSALVAEGNALGPHRTIDFALKAQSRLAELHGLAFTRFLTIGFGELDRGVRISSLASHSLKFQIPARSFSSLLLDPFPSFPLLS